MSPFYSGGFLIDPKSKRILLHKRDNNTENNPGIWAFFGGLSEENEQPIQAFIREIQEELGIKLKIEEIHKLTDYFNSDFNTHRYVFYADVNEQTIFNLNEGEEFKWYYLSELEKIEMSKRTLEDLELFKKII